MATPGLKNRRLWQICLMTSAEAEEAVAAMLERLFGPSISVYTRSETKTSVVTAYSAQPAGRLKEKRKELTAQLRFIARCGLNIQPGRIRIQPVSREDWAESWRKYFKTIEIGSTLLIKPSWSRRKPRPTQETVVIDPGLSFGTGQHPTTAFCLQQLVRCRNPGQNQSFLDMGTGSGILAVAAAKIGYWPVQAFDFDPMAVRAAQANARRNKVSDRICIQRADLRRMPRLSRDRHDVVCANLVDDLLVSEANRIVNRLQTGGRLIVAGILAQQFPSVQKAYAQLGLKLQASRTEREWQSAVFIGTHSRT